MIHDLEILSGGEDLAQQAIAAVTSRGAAETMQHLHSHAYIGHTQESDDAKSFPEMVQNFGRDHLQPMLDRTHGNATPAEIRAAATAACKGAARLIQFANKCHRQADSLEAAEKEEG